MSTVFRNVCIHKKKHTVPRRWGNLNKRKRENLDLFGAGTTTNTPLLGPPYFGGSLDGQVHDHTPAVAVFDGNEAKDRSDDVRRRSLTASKYDADKRGTHLSYINH